MLSMHNIAPTMRLLSFTSASSARPMHRCVVRCRLGGGGGDQRPRLIIPGQNDQQRSGGGLIIPGQSSVSSGSGLSLSGSNGGVQQNFRPPPGFMDIETKAEDGDVVDNLSTDQMLLKLRSLSGHWYDLARLLPRLQALGYDSTAVEAETGLERKTQSLWQSSAQVHDSIKKSGKLTPQQLAFFDMEDGDATLYELRMLSITQRSQAAAYIADMQLGDKEAQTLARAVKDHERRGGAQEGFSTAPGDCLAYKLFRDAMECRRKEEYDSCLAKAMAVAVTPEAIAKLKTMLGEKQGQRDALPTATLTTLRMTRDEVAFRPVPIAGTLSSTAASAVLAAPKVAATGTFAAFRLPKEGLDLEWVPMPSWSVVLLAQHPVLLTVPNCANVPQVVTSAAAKTEDELKRLAGPGLLLADLARAGEPVQEDKYYLVENADGAVGLEEGSLVTGRVLGLVLFLCRPPNRETAASGTSELLSV